MSNEQMFLSLAYSSVDTDDPMRNALVGHCSDNADNIADYVKEVLGYVEIFEDIADHQISNIDPEDENAKEEVAWLRNLITESKSVSLSELAKLAVEDWLENCEG